MSEVLFPTTRPERTGGAAAKVIEVYDGYNASYGPKGRQGLYIKVKYTMSETKALRDIFFPEPPAAKTDRLMKALEDLEIDIATNGWKSLEGYVLRWTKEEVEREIFERESQTRKTIKMQLEYPTEIISSPGDETVDGEGTAETPRTTADLNGDYEVFKDEVVTLADGKTNRQLRLDAAKDPKIRTFPAAFRQKLSSGAVIEELKAEGRLTENGDGDEPVFEAAI